MSFHTIYGLFCLIKFIAIAPNVYKQVWQSLELLLATDIFYEILFKRNTTPENGNHLPSESEDLVAWNPRFPAFKNKLMFEETLIVLDLFSKNNLEFEKKEEIAAESE